MKKTIAILLGLMMLMPALLVAGCKANEAPPSGEQTEPTENAATSEAEHPLLEGLIKNEYDGIEITVNVLERMAILPGAPVPVTVTVTNTGDKSVFYVQGSGSFETPQALFLQSEQLQPVRPSDQLGIATMDFVTKELKPGENLIFKLYVMAIEPNTKFDDYTYEMFNEGVYIADMEWPTLHERYPDLTAVPSGSYTVNAYFVYTFVDVVYTGAGEDGQNNAFGEATGYAAAECMIGVS